MKKLNELYNVDSNVVINDIKINSKEVKEGDLFICTMGVNADRHDFIDDAIKNGAAAIVVSKDVGEKNVSIIKVSNTNKELPLLCARFYDNPQDKLTIIGVTGTDGKTSVSTIIQTLLGKENCGYIGTNGRSCAKFNLETSNTTPDADKLYKYFNEFVLAGCKYVVMEASSEAFFRGRLADLVFDSSVLTNVTSEHLNIHKTFENYLSCKGKLFKQTKKDGFSVLNKDDAHYSYMKDCSNANDIYTYGKNDSTFQIVSYEVKPNLTNIVYRYNNKELKIESPLLGDFNVYNLAAAILVAINYGVSFSDIEKRIKDVSISGRMEMINTNSNYYVMVDYAHTPNGIESLLKFVHTLDINRSIVVQGVAGERDFLKRPIMGKTLVDSASYVIFTYEDPRSEDPKDIIDMMIRDVKGKYDNYEIVLDRHDAIKRGIDLAGEKDIVLILGKGNENYEKLKDKVIYFNDIEEAKKAIKERNNN